AKICASHKQNLILVARSGDKLHELASELTEKHGIIVHVFEYDLSVISNIEKLFQEISKESLEVEILVNNAGFGDSGDFITTSWEKEQRMINLNISALTLFTKLFAKSMVERKKGHILNVASTASFQPGPSMSVYFATKAYVLNFSEALSFELRGTGVSVTTLCPGATQTGFAAAANVETANLFDNKLPTGKEVAIFGFNAMMKGKRLAIHGFKNRLMVFSLRLSPRKWVMAVSAWMMKK
ncbi:MAG: SDR family oxidoreductase, partial [Bacteroidetes bacterium]|nr:SDR family oxidoreductase [Bacteroidota bacterium]